MQLSKFLSPNLLFRTVLRFVLLAVNTACLVLIGYNTVHLWTDSAFDMIETARNFPDESEFADSSLIYQIWGGISCEPLMFLFGGFLCYERFVRAKSLPRNLSAPIVLAFVWASGNAVGLFLPALDKISQIRTCLSTDITWNEKEHACNVMDLEKRRMDKFLAELKATRKKAFRPVYAPFYNPAVVHKPVEPVVETADDKTAEKLAQPVKEEKKETVKPAPSSKKILKKVNDKKSKKAVGGTIIKKTPEKKQTDNTKN